MRRVPASFEATVRAFREATASPADGSATRARVLARVGEGTERRAMLRRTSVAVGIALAAFSSASVAVTLGSRTWRAPRPSILEVDGGSTSAPTIAKRAIRSIPFAYVAPVVVPDPVDAESRAYGLAHRTHFNDGVPPRALRAWDAYLAAYPSGVFAPEAHFNRALCLIRLARFAEAERALGPFARGRPGAYRQAEASLLLEWLRDSGVGLRPGD
jgi:hypothetical protein